ncbi:26186_t:CDS:2, partial [Gigaspora rosea]
KKHEFIWARKKLWPCYLQAKIEKLQNENKALKEEVQNLIQLQIVNVDLLREIEFNELLKNYGCSSAGENPNKTLVKGILQRHLINM